MPVNSSDGILTNPTSLQLPLGDLSVSCQSLQLFIHIGTLEHATTPRLPFVTPDVEYLSSSVKKDTFQENLSS